MGRFTIGRRRGAWRRAAACAVRGWPLALVLAAGPAFAQATADAAPAEPDEAAEQARDACDRKEADEELQEEAQDLLRSWSCHTFRWFDSWWGSEHDFDESDVSGWMLVGAEYRKYDGFDPRLRLKVRAPLPNLSTRWDVWLGRLDEEAYISDTDPRDDQFYNSGLVDRGDDEAWLLGLGHRRGRGRQGWDWSVGVRLRLPPEPYAKLSWLHRRELTPDTDLRFRQTFFWRSDDGFGTTSRVNVTTRLGARDVLLWEGIGRITEETQGVKWFTGNTWYHLLQSGSAISLLTFVEGETDRPVGVTDGGFQLTWRRPFTRDWMYLAMGPSLTWPRRQPEDEREMNLGFGVWIEMEFGDWRY